MDANDFQLVFLDGAAHFVVEEDPTWWLSTY